MLDPVFGIVPAAAMALLLLAAAWHKWRARAEFSAVLAAYRLLPRRMLPLAAWLTPTLETAIAAGLLARATRPAAALLGCALLLAYAGAIAVNLRRGRRDLDCGCSGPYDRRPVARGRVVSTDPRGETKRDEQQARIADRARQVTEPRENSMRRVSSSERIRHRTDQAPQYVAGESHRDDGHQDAAVGPMPDQLDRLGLRERRPL